MVDMQVCHFHTTAVVSTHSGLEKRTACEYVTESVTIHSERPADFQPVGAIDSSRHDTPPFDPGLTTLIRRTGEHLQWFFENPWYTMISGINCCLIDKTGSVPNYGRNNTDTVPDTSFQLKPDRETDSLPLPKENPWRGLRTFIRINRSSCNSHRKTNWQIQDIYQVNSDKTANCST
jgi:hypothetical protein